MKEYDFSLKFRLPEVESDPVEYVVKLEEAGCEDALVGVGQRGRIALDFIREAKSAFDAITSAIADVKKAIPNAVLIEATPDLVGLTDAADILGFTRQNMRKLMIKGGDTFPLPVHEGASSIYHFAQILIWLRDIKSYSVEEDLMEIAQTNMEFNLLKEASKHPKKNLGEVVPDKLRPLFS